MAATYKAVFPACGPAVWAADGRRAYRGGTSGPSYDAEASDYFTRAGITDETKQDAINDFIVGVKVDFTITTLDEVFDQLVLQANESAAAAVVDMTANAMDQTLVNSPTFTQWQGITKAGGTDYINTGFNPVTQGVRFTLNSHAFGSYFLSGGTSAMGSINAGFAGFQIWLEAGGNTFLARDSTSSAEITPSNGGNKTGLLTVSRTASNAWAFYQNGTSVATATSGPGALISQNFEIIGVNTNGSHGPANATTQAALSFFSRGMTAGEMTAFSARVATLKTAIGW